MSNGAGDIQRAVMLVLLAFATGTLVVISIKLTAIMELLFKVAK